MAGLYDPKQVQELIDETVADLEERRGYKVYVDSVRVRFMTHNGDLIAEVDIPITVLLLAQETKGHPHTHDLPPLGLTIDLSDMGTI